MTTLTDYTVDHFLTDMGWTDSGVTFVLVGITADFVFDPATMFTAADAIAAGAEDHFLFEDTIINRASDLTARAYASPVTHINASASGRATQLLIIRDPAGDGQICAQIDIPDLDVLDTDEVLVAWPDLGWIWDVLTVTLAPAIVSIAKFTNGLTDFVVRAWGDDVIGWEDDGNNGFFLIGLDATYTYDPVAHISLADIGSAGATVYFGLDLPTFSSGRTRSGATGLVTPFSGSDEFSGPSGVVTQVVLVEAVVNDEDFVGNPLENWLVCGHATLAGAFDWTSGGTIGVSWASDEVLDADTPEFFVPTLTGSTPPDEGASLINLELYLLVDGERDWVTVDSVDDNVGVTTARTATQQGTIFSYDGGRLGATIDNNDGSAQWSSANLAGPWVVDDVSLLDQGLPTRLIITPPGGDPIRVFTGLVSVWPVTYDQFLSSVAVSVTDAVDQLNHSDLAPSLLPIGAGQGSGVRDAAVLARVGWDPTNDDIDETPWGTLQATTFTSSPWSDIQNAQESDGAFTWINAHGGVSHQLRSWPIGKTPAVVFSNLGEDGTVEYYAAKPSAARKTNVIQYTREGGIAQTSKTRDAAPGNYHSYTHTGLGCETDRQVKDLTLWHAGWFGHKQQFEFGQLATDLLPDTDPTIWAAVLGLDLFDVVEIHMKTEDGQTNVRQALIQGVTGLFTEHKVTMTFDLAPAPPASNTTVYDDPAALYDAPGVRYGFAMAA